jgi:hypothetical protein
MFISKTTRQLQTRTCDMFAAKHQSQENSTPNKIEDHVSQYVGLWVQRPIGSAPRDSFRFT